MGRQSCHGPRGPRCHAPKPREPACRLAYGASGKRAEGQIRARCRTTACIGGTFAVRKPAGSSADAIADRVGGLWGRLRNPQHSPTTAKLCSADSRAASDPDALPDPQVIYNDKRHQVVSPERGRVRMERMQWPICEWDSPSRTARDGAGSGSPTAHLLRPPSDYTVLVRTTTTPGLLGSWTASTTRWLVAV
jgi:hypothetical protein